MRLEIDISQGYRVAEAEFRKKLLAHTLKATKDNKSQAARKLKIHRNTLVYILKGLECQS